MKFQEMAETFNQIEPISSRIEITKLLADLLSKANPEEAKIISYFSLGTLNPPYVGTQFQFAQKSAQKVIEKLLNINSNQLKDKLKLSGDLGLIIEKGDWGVKNSKLTVVQVYQKLSDIEKTAGTGSQELKFEKVLDLLEQLDPISAKYIIRIVIDKLRLGFSDMTLIDAISWMLVGDKSLKAEIENKYNLCADIGLIAYSAKSGGMKEIEKLNVEIGIPIRMAAAERLPNAQEVIEKLGPCVAQPKLDGFRLQVHIDKSDKKSKKTFIRLFSRNLIDMSDMFPDLVHAFENLDVKNIICEGEAVAYDPHSELFLPFQETVKRKRKYGIEEIANDLPLKLFIFDILYLDDKLLLDLTHEQRRKKIENIFNNFEYLTLQVIPEKKVNTAKELDQYFLQNINSGLEGLVVKRPDAIYQPGKRNFNWIKLKRESQGELNDKIDTVILGYYHGSGKRAKFGIGAFLVGIYNKKKDIFQTLAKVGTGLTDEKWVELKSYCDAVKTKEKPNNIEIDKTLYPDVWTYPEIVCEVFADEITQSPVHTAGKTEEKLGFALRFPRFIGFRPDKKATQTTSIIELQEMFDMQYGKK